MKTKIYFSFLFVSLLFIATISSAQSGRFSVGAEAGLALGNNIYSKSSYPLGFGLSFRYEHPIGDKLAVMGTIGGQYFYNKGFDIAVGGNSVFTNQTVSTLITVPIMVGVRYYVSEQQKGFYGSFETGMAAAIGSGNSNATTSTFQGSNLSQSNTSGTDTTVNFAFAPGFGYHLSRVDFGMRYQSIAGKDGSFNTLNLRIGLVFGKR